MYVKRKTIKTLVLPARCIQQFVFRSLARSRASWKRALIGQAAESDPASHPSALVNRINFQRGQDIVIRLS